ncbi:unnamed protein product [Ostreobium quekettii]|uniref:UGP3-like C-terminal hexapeptide repeats domain-containing protein n=1 Tax=Ostreobium quekettii TaxID=121088 RepID=A0A8S1IVC6_9CHLO|nr:unnamed protein product [Ostreobium quekettii]
MFGTQPVIPIVLMTSDAKANHQKITALLESRSWYRRGKEMFRIIKQPLVPVVAIESGKWLVSRPLRLVMKPGGHGVIWKLMQDHGVFDWLQTQDAVAAVVRQISNPLAGTDTTLLALAGAGYSQGKAMGFASCERVVGASEGMIVLRHESMPPEGSHPPSHKYGLTNIEYTEFERLGITDTAVEGGSSTSCFPANTNILYIGLEATRQAVMRGAAEGGGAALPGLIFNMKKKVKYYNEIAGKAVAERAGRMECMMQNLADSLADSMSTALPVGRHDLLSTFMVHNHRRRVTSSAKRKMAPGATNLRQTPEGSFWDLMANAKDLLRLCGVETPELTPIDQYLSTGPSFIFLFHPALGPLWEVVAQKVQGGRLTRGSELVLEVAEAWLRDVVVDGSLVIESDDVMGLVEDDAEGRNNERGWRDPATDGKTERRKDGKTGLSSAGNGGVPLKGESTTGSSRDDSTTVSLRIGAPVDEGCSTEGGADPRLVFGSRCGRVWMENVVVRNRGLDWKAPGNVYWEHQVVRRECARVVLHGQSEFVAVDVVIEGDMVFEVPHRCRMDVSNDEHGGVVTTLICVGSDEPSWQWRYTPGEDGSVRLEVFELDLEQEDH